MKFRKLAVGVTLALAAITAQANFSNPGFETGDFSSWIGTGDAASVTDSATVFGIKVTPASGSYMAQLGSGFFNLAIQGTESTTSPVTFYYRLIAGAGETADLTVAHASLLTPTSTQVDYLSSVGATGVFDSGWRTFTAASTSTAIEFYQSSFNGNAVAFVDAAPAVPEPETYAMLLAGLSMVGALARRRKSAERA